MKTSKTKFKIKKGDRVEVISGAHKGAQGEVQSILRNKSRVIVEGVNIVKKHMKPSNTDAGGIREMEAPIHISNVMLIDPKSGETTRVGFRREDGVSMRYSKSTGENID